MNKVSKILFALTLPAFLLLPLANADCEGGHCPLKEGMGHDMQKSPCPITNQFFSDAHEMLEHKKDLGLTEDQIKTIKDLKLQMKKHEIKQMADMQIMMLDMRAQLNEDKPDVEAISAMIDQGSAAMASGAKEVLTAYAKLKSVMTAEQWQKMKEVD